ncbi:hypothetical protein MTR67_025823 [Solanum verrucosum]|uniref:Tf2-1-like SH3-like domain-containing protein n=1 Tax=Solanum verrucosum TaxID=315347 RepID=A0AAF0TZI7_SOLVR|nr:hypothetical protein MTR67_025823 [Solanum verrucosum]
MNISLRTMKCDEAFGDSPKRPLHDRNVSECTGFKVNYTFLARLQKVSSKSGFKGFERSSRRGEKEKSQGVLQIFLRIECCFAKGLIPKRGNIVHGILSKRIGNVAYELELPSELAAVNPVFHISMLKNCMGDPSRNIPTEDIGIKDSLSYEEIPIQLLDHQIYKLRTKEVASFKVLWRNQFVEEAT